MVIVVVVVAVRWFDNRSAPPPRSAAADQAAVPVTASLARRQDVPDIVSVLGTVQSIDSVSVQARVNGPIIKIEFVPGQEVKQGQELFLIDPRPFQAALDQAQAQLAHDQGLLAEAQVDLTRYQTLARQNSIARQQAEDQAYVVAQDKGTVELDQANVETAQLNLEFCHVASPIDGRAGALLVDLGNLVGPTAASSAAGGSTSSTGAQSASTGSSMVSIVQMQPIYVSFNVPQSTLDDIRRYQASAPLEVDAYAQDGKFLEKGKLTLIDNQVNTAAGTVLLQGTFANTSEALWPGQFVRVRLVVFMQRNVVTVPAEAVMEGPNGAYVYVINPDETVHRVAVAVGTRQDQVAVITSGLSGSEKIVVDGQYRLDEGVKVDIQSMVEAASG